MLDELLLALLKGIKTECLKSKSCSKCPFADKHTVQERTIPVIYSYEFTCSIGIPESWTLEVDGLEVDE